MPGRRDDWLRLKDVFEKARTLAPEARSAYLAETCRDDGELRREVESLLGAYARASNFLETPAAQVFPDYSTLGSLNGRRIGPYELSSLVGSGGMGDVYKAVDTRLGRTVAIKVLPARPGSDPTAHERFEREARAVAALNHPNIC